MNSLSDLERNSEAKRIASVSPVARLSLDYSECALTDELWHGPGRLQTQRSSAGDRFVLVMWSRSRTKLRIEVRQFP